MCADSPAPLSSMWTDGTENQITNFALDSGNFPQISMQIHSVRIPGSRSLIYFDGFFSFVFYWEKICVFIISLRQNWTTVLFTTVSTIIVCSIISNQCTYVR